MISAYSVCSAVIYYNLALIAVFMLRRNTVFIVRYGTNILLFITALGVIRLFTPIDFSFAVVIPSRHLLPSIQSILSSEFFGFGIRMSSILLFIWGFGIAYFLLHDAASQWRFHRIRKSYTFTDCSQVKRLMGSLTDKYVVRVSADVNEPFVAGLFHPVIYIPEIELTDEDMSFILRHELQHIISHDALKKLVFLMIRAVFWWNPFAHMTVREIDTLLELRCDAVVTSRLDDKSVYEYLCALISVMKQICPSTHNENSNTVNFVGRVSEIKQRFEVIMSKGKCKAKNTNHLLCSILLLFFLISYTVIVQPAYAPPSDELVGTIALTSENSYIQFEDGGYHFYINGNFVAELDENELKEAPYNKLPIKGV